jgi:lysophospholipase L1-like esterase
MGIIMKDTKLSDSTVKVLRKIAIVSGSVLILLALFSNLLGLSTSSGLSSNQIIFAAAGIILIITGFLGRRFPVFYGSTAKILLSIVIAVIILDLLSLVLVKLIDPERFRIRAQKIEVGHLDEVEYIVVSGRYEPFVVWRSNPIINCDSITITDDGFRLTPGISHNPDAFSVLMLGGSAMWGVGVSDSGTIAANLQRDLSELIEKPVAVFNLAQAGHSSTQEVIELMLQLRNGDIPDLVIFYDGFNDVWGAYENGLAGVHHSLESIAGRVEGTDEALGIMPVWKIILSKTNTWLLVTSLRSKGILPQETVEIPTYRTMGINFDTLTSQIVSVYYGNCRVIEALADFYEFDCLFIWHPTIWTGDKALSDREHVFYEGGHESFLAGGDTAFIELLQASYDLFEESIIDSTRYFSFRTIFDETEDEVYLDYSGAHVSAEANEMIAEELIRIISETWCSHGEFLRLD